MSEESMTFGEALKTTHCPKCGAVPGEDCRDSKPLPKGMHRVHTERVFRHESTGVGAMSLTEFLLARIAEDEAQARQAVQDNGFGNGVRIVRGKAEHIARWDPARVLAECEAKRRIVAEHPHTFREGDGNLVGDEWHCERCLPEYWYWCATLRALAAVDADHPDYLPEWA